MTNSASNDKHPATKKQNKISKAERFLEALKSSPFSVVVGPEKVVYNIPRDLLTGCSPYFKAVIQGSFEEGLNSTLTLEDEEVITFESFYGWLYRPWPIHIGEPGSPPGGARLLVFADKYQILSFRNAITDNLRYMAKVHCPPADTISRIYGSTLPGSPLRDLYSTAVMDSPTGPQSDEPDEESIKAMIEASSDFAWDIMKMLKGGHRKLKEGARCRFHDHSDVVGFDRDTTTVCPHDLE